MTTTLDYEPYPPTRLAFHASRIIIDVGVLLVLAAMSLPFVSAEGFGQKAVAADALPALLLVLPIFVITLLPDQTRPVPSVLGWASLLLAATAAPYAVVKALDASTLAHTVGGRVGAGAWLLVVGALVTLAGIVYGLVRNLLGLPVAGTYPARPRPVEASRRAPVTTPAASTSAPRATSGAGPQAAAQPPPRRLLRGSPSPATTRPSRRPASAPPSPPAAEPQPAQPAPPVSPPPLPTSSRDPDTEPTLPAVKPVRHWWPDDLENLFD